MSTKPFWITVVGGLLCSASLIYWADPPGRWHRAPAFPQRDLQPGEVWIFASNHDTRAQRLNQIHWMSRADVVFLGSSRVMRVASTMMNARRRIANLGIVYPTISDYVRFWKALEQDGKRPSYLILFADPWIVNRHAHFAPQTPPRKSTLEPSASIVTRIWEYLWYAGEYARFEFSQLGEFFRASELIDALKHLKTGYPESHAALAWILPESQMTPLLHGLRWDGSLVDFPPPTSVEDLRDHVRRVYAFRKNSPFARWDVDLKAVAQLNDFLKTVTREGTRVMVILPPYHPAAYQRFQETAADREGMSAYRNSLREVAEDARNVTLCDAQNPELLGCSETEFQDEHHMRDACVEKLLSTCFSPHPPWRELLPES